MYVWVVNIKNEGQQAITNEFITYGCYSTCGLAIKAITNYINEINIECKNKIRIIDIRSPFESFIFEGYILIKNLQNEYMTFSISKVFFNDF